MEEKDEERAQKLKEAREEKIKRRKRQVLIQRIVIGVFCLIVLFGTEYVMQVFPWQQEAENANAPATSEGTDDWTDSEMKRLGIDVQLLTVNEYSRPGIPTSGIKGVVIHYVANPGSTAQENRDYFENLKDTHYTKASSNFIVGLQGEIIQCIPTSEIAYASNSRNSDTVSIETCHPDETGKFNDATYDSLVELTAFLCNKFGLDSENVIRHYDVTGKICPKYFVENEDAWETFRSDVSELIK